MNAADIEVVAEDLEYLRTAFGPDISDPDIRRGSAVLRRLLVEGVFGNAWRSAGFERQPSLIAVDLDSVVGSEGHKVVCAMAWGAHFRGVLMASPCTNDGSTPIGSATPPVRKDGYPGERTFSLTDFLESTSGVTKQIRVNRREVIKYVANVKGGVHLGPKAKASEQELIKKMEKFERIMSVNTTDGILVELVAIAQAVAFSGDTARFLAKVRGRGTDMG
jgi:hypothetical protein